MAKGFTLTGYRIKCRLVRSGHKRSTRGKRSGVRFTKMSEKQARYFARKGR